MIRNNWLKLFACFALIYFPLNGEPSPIDLKGMSTCMKPDYKLLAPAIGALFWISPLIQNIHKFGDDSQGTVQLIKNLFSYNIDGITFDTTNSYLKIARYFTAEDIGKLVGAIYSYFKSSLSDKDLQVLRTKVYKVISDRAKTDEDHIKQSIVAGLQTTINRQKNQIISLVSKIKGSIDASLPAWSFLDSLAEGTLPTDEIINHMNDLLHDRSSATIHDDLQSLTKVCEQISANSSALTEEKKTKIDLLKDELKGAARKFETTLIPADELEALRRGEALSPDRIAVLQQVVKKGLASKDKKEHDEANALQSIAGKSQKINAAMKELQQKTAQLQRAAEALAPGIVADQQLEALKQGMPLSSRDIELLRHDEAKASSIAEIIKLSEDINKINAAPLNNTFFNANVGKAEFKYRDGSTEFSLYKAIIQTVQEEHAEIYPLGFTNDILLAWLWKHTADRIEFRHYLEMVATALNKPAAEIFTWPDPLEHFNRGNYDVLSMIQAALNSGRYPREAARKYFSLEDTLFAYEGYNLYLNPLPPLVGMIFNMEYHAHNGKWYREVPDCGETALRNIFDALFKDPRANKFDMELIKSLTTNTNLINFYTKYDTMEKIKTLQAHNDWAMVVSELPGVKYYRDNAVEIGSGISNMLTVINYLIPGAKTFDGLAQKFQQQNVRLKWNVGTPLFVRYADDDNTVTLTIEQQGLQPAEIRWQFSPGHFQVYFPEVHLSEYVKGYMSLAEDAIDWAPNSLKFTYVVLYSLCGASVKEIKHKIFGLSEGLTKQLLPFFMLPFGEMIQKMKLFLIQNIESGISNPYFRKVITSLYSSLPRDSFSLELFFNSFIGVSTPERTKLTEDLAAVQRTDAEKSMYLTKVLMWTYELTKDEQQNVPNVEMLKPLYIKLREILPTIKNEKLQVSLIKNIIDATSLKNREIIKPWYEWVKQVLPGVGSNRVALEEFLLENKFIIGDIFTDEEWKKIERALHGAGQ